jgi:endonuclease/exonuclease/phosphatase family metal-dependent hydrolase
MPITITTWNVQNFNQGDQVYNEKLNFLIDTLQALGSDIVALQEILDPNALQDLAGGLGFHHIAAAPDGRGNRVALLTRNAPIQSEQIDQWQLPQGVDVRSIVVLQQFSRPAFRITIAHDGGQLDVVTAHLKSKLLTFGGNFSTSDETLRAHTAYFALERRSAEATSLREYVTSRLAANRDVIVLGDLNDGPEAATTQILYGPPGSQPRGPNDATHAAGAFQRSDAADARRLFNVTKLLPDDVRWSRRHNGQNELLDHILASEGLMPKANGLRQVPILNILNDDTPSLLGAHPTAGGVIPDHAPVTATFV